MNGEVFSKTCLIKRAGGIKQMLRQVRPPIVKKKVKQDRLRKCVKCKKEGLDRRRASEHKAKCWEKDTDHWLFQRDDLGAYNLLATEVAGNNFNRKQGTTAIEPLCTGKHRRIGASESAWRDLATFKHGELGKKDTHKVVLPGIRFLMINLGLCNHSLNWQRLKQLVKGGFFLGACAKYKFLSKAKSKQELRELLKYYTSDDEGVSGNDFDSSQSSENFLIKCK
jgi:hypothetical protein